jgi:hypothetical protein
MTKLEKDSILLWSWVHGLFGSTEMNVFGGSPPSAAVDLQVARDEALLWTMAGAKGLSSL